jgi:hypothetical protein
MSLSEIKHLEFCRLNTGELCDVLFEHTRHEGMITGLTGNYLRTEYPWNSGFAGKIIKVKLMGISVSGRMNVELVN